MSKQFCEHCGAQLDDGSMFCTACGKPVAGEQTAYAAPTQQGYTVPVQPYAPTQGYAAQNRQSYMPPQGYAAPVQQGPALEVPPQKRKKELPTVAVIGITAGSVFLLAALLLLGINLFGKGASDGPPSGQEELGTPSAITESKDESDVASPDMPLPEPTDAPAEQPAQTMVTDAAIPIEHAESVGTIRYSGAVDENGLPNGEGTGKMEADAEGNAWTYTGMWEHGHFSGRGEFTHHTKDYVQSGEFKDDVLSGYGTQQQHGVLRYEGEWANGDLHGHGKLYTRTGEFLYEGPFERNLLLETQAERERRAAPFMEDCESMDTAFYASWQDGYDASGYPLDVWGSIIGLSEQGQTGTVIINMHDDADYPVALTYRYAADEPKMTAEYGSLSAWGYCVGTFSYTRGNEPATCPEIEVVFWRAGDN